MKRKNTSEFIDDAKQVHGDRYSYEMVGYKGVEKKVKIICPDHGVFEQTPKNHLNGHGCPKCASTENGISCRKGSSLFIDNAKQIHGDKYDYSLVEYKTAHTKVKIICPDHGVFEQTPNSHTRKIGCHGCPICSGKKKHDIDTFIIKANQIHDNKYDYSLVEYKNNKIHVSIICPVHGVFDQRPDHHFRGQGCIQCLDRNISKQEVDFVEFISSVYNSEIITNTRSVIPPYELDVYLPDLQMAFEYNGTYWHKEGVNVPVGYHQMKTDMCMDKGVELHHIWEQDWTGNRDEVLTRVIDLLR